MKPLTVFLDDAAENYRGQSPVGSAILAGILTLSITYRHQKRGLSPVVSRWLSQSHLLTYITFKTNRCESLYGLVTKQVCPQRFDR